MPAGLRQRLRLSLSPDTLPMMLNETLRGFVNAWDCDENDHLNVQFYFRFFEDAAAHAWLLAGIAPGKAPRLLARHVRYHAELLANQSIRIDTTPIAPRDGASRLLHVMRETASGRLAATAIDDYDETPAGARHFADGAAPLPPEAAPRSLAPGPAIAEAAEGGFLSLRSRLRQQDFIAGDLLSSQALVGRFSDAAAQFWTGIGVSTDWLAAENLGRVAVELKLTPLGTSSAGTPIHLLTRLVSVARVTITFQHRVHDSAAGTLIAIGDVTALTMDQATRRARPLPDDMRALLASRIGAGRLDSAL